MILKMKGKTDVLLLYFFHPDKKHQQGRDYEYRKYG
jgi:hypothetical protein